MAWPPPSSPLPSLVQSLLFVARPLEFLGWMRRRYGRVFRIQSRILGADVLYVADPRALSEVFRGDADTFHAGEANGVLEPVAGSRSILLLDEDAHLRQRKLVLPAFHGDAIRRYRATMVEATRREVERWPVGRPFALRPRMQAITLDVIVRVVFGIRDAERMTRLKRLIPRLFEVSLIAVAAPALRKDLGPWSPWGRFVRARDAVDAILYEEIERRRRAPDSDDDVLGLLLGARDEDGRPMAPVEVRDQLVTLLLAGHETTATALAWTFERLLRHPAALARLREEVSAGGGEYLKAVIKESLRVRPVVLDVARKLTRTTTVAGYDAPAGTVVMPSIALVHRSPDHYEDPYRFDPERFLGEAPAPYTWLPFGGGRRRCAGAAFAQLEMEVVLAEILRATALAAPTEEDEPMRMRGIVLSPAHGARAICTGKHVGATG